MSYSRRYFIAGLGAAATAATVPVEAARLLETPVRLYPPMDLSYFETPIFHGPSAVQIGYAAIAWDRKDRQAIDEISALGYPGIQLRANVLSEFPDPHALKELLAKHNLTFVALSSDGGASLDPGQRAKCIATNIKNARYLREAGGKYLQIVGPSSIDRHCIAADYKYEGKLLTEIARRVSDFGIQTGFHNHMDSIAQTPAQLDAILSETDPQYVKLALDVAHYFQGGGDPAATVRKYGDRLLFLHLKDVEPSATSDAYKFVELGQRKVNFPAIFTALHDVHFRGWTIVELDGERVGNTRSPKQSAEMSKEYLTKKLGVSL